MSNCKYFNIESKLTTMIIIKLSLNNQYCVIIDTTQYTVHRSLMS